jgi:hypothetical protein
VIEFPPSIPDEWLLKKAVRWSLRHRYPIPSLSDLSSRKSVEELTSIGRAWQNAGLGSMIEQSSDGHRTVHFVLHDEALFHVNELNKKSFVGRLKTITRSEWIALLALIVSFVALFKPGS